jgi:hypothetical protein
MREGPWFRPHLHGREPQQSGGLWGSAAIDAGPTADEIGRPLGLPPGE